MPSQQAKNPEQRSNPAPADTGKPSAPGKSKKELDKELDRALAESFPASDPPAASSPTAPGPAGDPATKP